MAVFYTRTAGAIVDSTAGENHRMGEEMLEPNLINFALWLLLGGVIGFLGGGVFGVVALFLLIVE